MIAINHKNIKTEDIKIFEGTYPQEFQQFRDGYFINVLPQKIKIDEPDELILRQHEELGLEYKPEDTYRFYCCFVKASSQEELDALKEEMLYELTKYYKEKALAEIVVTISNGAEIDGDIVGRNNMLSAIQASELLGIQKHEWKLADNTFRELNVSDLREALALSIQRAGEIYMCDNIIELHRDKTGVVDEQEN